MAYGVACNEGMHLLLQSTDIIWTILLAEYVNGEDLGVIEILAALCSGTGSFLIGLHAVDTLDEPLVPILATRRSHSNFVSFALSNLEHFGTIPRSLEHLKQSWSCLVYPFVFSFCSALEGEFATSLYLGPLCLNSAYGYSRASPPRQPTSRNVRSWVHGHQISSQCADRLRSGYALWKRGQWPSILVEGTCWGVRCWNTAGPTGWCFYPDFSGRNALKSQSLDNRAQMFEIISIHFRERLILRI